MVNDTLTYDDVLALFKRFKALELGKLTKDQLRGIFFAPSAKVYMVRAGLNHYRLPGRKTNVTAVALFQEFGIDIHNWTHPDHPGQEFRFGYCKELDVILVDERCLEEFDARW